MKITIITACLNNEDTIESCLDSLNAQTYPSIEHIVVDGGSTDGTLDIIGGRKGAISTLISEKDGGFYFALNKGLGRATGDVIGFLSADDLFIDPDVLVDIAGVFSNTMTESCYAGLYYVNRKDTDRIIRVWRPGPYGGRDLFKRGWMPPHPTFYARREVYQKYGGFNTAYGIAADYELMMRFLFKHGVSSHYLPRVILKMRYGGISNKSLRYMLRKTAEDYRICASYGLGAGTIFMKNIAKLSQFMPGGLIAKKPKRRDR